MIGINDLGDGNRTAAAMMPMLIQVCYMLTPVGAVCAIMAIEVATKAIST